MSKIYFKNKGERKVFHQIFKAEIILHQQTCIIKNGKRHPWAEDRIYTKVAKKEPELKTKWINIWFIFNI